MEPSPRMLLPRVKRAMKIVGGDLLRLRSNAEIVRFKDSKHEVSQADLAAESKLRRFLQQIAPRISFLSEENAETEWGSKVVPERPCWIVDPLDGTTTYLRRKASFGIHVGLVWGGARI